MKIIPAIDIIDGKCVRLVKGDFSRKSVYASNPVEVAKEFEGNGLHFLHLVDLDGAKTRSPKNLKILEDIAKGTSLTIDFGGGVSSATIVNEVFSAGATQINIGSLPIRSPQEFIEILNTWGGNKIIFAADVFGLQLATDAWQNTSEKGIIETIQSFIPYGLTYVTCTDISKDGMMKGPSIDLYRQLIDQTTVKIIASGGVANLTDLELLQKVGVAGIIIGKAIYEGQITLKELSEYA